LTRQQIKDLKDLDPLASLKHLEFLSLHHAPVSHLKHYRHWLVFRCQKLRVLDFEKVRDKERQQARTLFQTETGEWTPLATSISAQVTAAPSTNGVKTFEPGMQSEDKGRLLTADDKQRIKQAIESATSIEEVRKLQRALELGFVPVRLFHPGGFACLIGFWQSEKELAALRKGLFPAA
jgi:U2 small nuclear ribonucleoprotein A'